MNQLVGFQMTLRYEALVAVLVGAGEGALAALNGQRRELTWILMWVFRFPVSEKLRIHSAKGQMIFTAIRTPLGLLSFA